MKCTQFLLVLSLVFTSGKNLSAQPSLHRFLTPSDTFNKQRALTIAIAEGGMYTGALIGLNQLWYADYPHSSFHFFNDNEEWLQMDKAGHAYTAYFETIFTTNALQWAGIRKNKAALIGAATGFIFQNTIEVLDGFSSQWGASAGDVIANAVGSSLGFTQYFLWNEQRIELKFSAHPVSYPGDLSARSKNLFGYSFAERTLKDYNGQTYWLSVNPSSFNKNSSSKFPAWLNIDFGYGADGLLGGFKNVWIENGETIDRTDVRRVRQFYLSPDIDFTRITTNSAILKTCFCLFNIIKIPAPALQINSRGSAKLYVVYF